MVYLDRHWLATTHLGFGFWGLRGDYDRNVRAREVEREGCVEFGPKVRGSGAKGVPFVRGYGLTGSNDDRDGREQGLVFTKSGPEDLVRLPLMPGYVNRRGK
jgi:hypothetical protein